MRCEWPAPRLRIDNENWALLGHYSFISHNSTLHAHSRGLCSFVLLPVQLKHYLKDIIIYVYPPLWHEKLWLMPTECIFTLFLVLFSCKTIISVNSLKQVIVIMKTRFVFWDEETAILNVNYIKYMYLRDNQFHCWVNKPHASGVTCAVILIPGKGLWRLVMLFRSGRIRDWNAELTDFL